MNKAQLVEALGAELDDKKMAVKAADFIFESIIRTVAKGEKVTITGFGVFEKRARAARTARNPRTGETVKVKKTNVPAFRAGTTFKGVLGGSLKLPKATAAKATKATAAKKTTTRAAAKPAAKRPTATKATAAKKTTTRATAAKKTAAGAKRGRPKK